MDNNMFDFSSLADIYDTLLNQDDLRLFYYDISRDCYTGFSALYSWNKDIEDYLDSHGVVIDGDDGREIPTSFAENEIYFSMKECDKGNKAAAFYRHLRNSFAHYRIGRSGDYFCMKDFLQDGQTLTMIGKINVNLFKGLISIFFSQKAKIEEEFAEQDNFINT